MDAVKQKWIYNLLEKKKKEQILNNIFHDELLRRKLIELRNSKTSCELEDVTSNGYLQQVLKTKQGRFHPVHCTPMSVLGFVKLKKNTKAIN